MILLKDIHSSNNMLKINESFLRNSTLPEWVGGGSEDIYITNVTFKSLIIGDFCKTLYLHNVTCDYIYCIGATNVILDGKLKIKYLKCSNVSHKSPETDVVSRIYTDDMIDSIYNDDSIMPLLVVYIDDNTWIVDFENKVMILSKLIIYTQHEYIRDIPSKVYDLLHVGISELI